MQVRKEVNEVIEGRRRGGSLRQFLADPSTHAPKREAVSIPTLLGLSSAACLVSRYS